MPLAHSPHKPVPAVQLLSLKTITLQEAIDGMRKAVEVAGGNRRSLTDLVDVGPGSGVVNYQYLPGILRSLENDWAPLQNGERAADCFAEVRGHLEIHLHPHFMGAKLIAGLRGAAGVLLLRMNHALGCVPIGFTHLAPVGSQAALVGESPYLHFLVEFRSVAFVPREEQFLVGRIAEDQTRMGINVTLMNVIHFYCSKERIRNDFWYDDVKGEWHRSEGEEGNDLGDLVDHRCDPVWVQTKSWNKSSGMRILTLSGVLTWPPVSLAGQKTAAPAKTPKKRVAASAAEGGGDEGDAGAAANGEAIDAPAQAKEKRQKEGGAAAAEKGGGGSKKRKKSAAGAFGKKPG